MEYRKKLIEVALPLEAINKQSAREKSIRHGHPSTLHLWWARRPLAAARAVIWASLVDDPSSLRDEFPTEEAQNAERERLFGILSELVKWENSNNQEVLAKAKAEIMKSTGGNPPALLDPFAGGGAIPLEAQRLGLEAHASDLNPVAVMINKAMIEIPPKFAGQKPMNPDARNRPDYNGEWPGATGLAEDVRYYGEWMKQKAFEKIGHLYPKVKDDKGQKHTVIAWIWARTVKCPNPVCGCEMPLIRSFELSKKKGKEAFVHYAVNNGKISYSVKSGKGAPKATINRKGAICVCCGSSVGYDYIREESREQRMGLRLIAVVLDSRNGRRYLPPSYEQINISTIDKPDNFPQGELAHYPGHLNTKIYGLDTFDKLFTNRQLTALTVFSDLIAEAQIQIETDSGDTDYAKAVSIYLAFAVDRLADFSTSVSRWSPSNEKAMNCFSKQAIPMTWDFPEVNILGESVGGFTPIVQYIADCMEKLPSGRSGKAQQNNAQNDNGMRNMMVSTDPPYYDNIGYADLSDFFYVWLRKALQKVYPMLFHTMLVPKAEELVAIQYHFDNNREKAKAFFEAGMLEAFKRVNEYARTDIPVTIYYAFKQSEDDSSVDGTKQTASTGWETMLSAIIKANFTISGTWPMRTEQISRMMNMNTNALASSIVLVCRKRPADAPMCTRRDFINELKRELKPALNKLKASNIAPVDMSQSAIGPGMSVYSRFSKVLEADGTPMSVRLALQIINQELDLYFTEQDGDIDRDSRFCMDLYAQKSFNNMLFGEADVLARAKNTSTEKLKRRGVVYSDKGIVRLLTRNEIPEKVDREIIWLLTQQLTHAMEIGGVEGVAEIIDNIPASEPEQAKALAYRLFQIAERKGWAAEALAYNSLVIAWPEIQAKVNDLQSQRNSAPQISFYKTTKE